MKLSHVALFVVVFVGLLTGLITIFADGVAVYGGENTNILSEYPELSSVVQDYNETYSTFQGTAAGGGDSNFFLNLDNMKAAVQQVFNGFKYASVVVEPVSDTFNLPSWITIMLTSIILIGLVITLVSAAIRWRIDHE